MLCRAQMHAAVTRIEDFANWQTGLAGGGCPLTPHERTRHRAKVFLGLLRGGTAWPAQIL